MSRKTEGQDWEFPEQISGPLSNSKIIERVSSQDKGLDPGSEIVIATSSLEVGFDDPNVGAIIQHKSPRNFAGFLQRKGRAGNSLQCGWTQLFCQTMEETECLPIANNCLILKLSLRRFL